MRKTYELTICLSGVPTSLNNRSDKVIDRMVIDTLWELSEDDKREHAKSMSKWHMVVSGTAYWSVKEIQ